MDFARIFTTSFIAKSLAAVAAAICAALGYYNDIGAYLMAWAPHVTPEIARLIFWAVSSALLLLLLALWIRGRRHQNLWAERDQLELSAIACLSVGKTIDQKYDEEPQLSRHRLLKDAIRTGKLEYIELGSHKPNVHTLVSRDQLRSYAKSTNNSDLLALVAKWERLNPTREPQPDQPKPPVKSVDADKFGKHTLTQQLPKDAPAKLLMRGWWLDYNPAYPEGKKELEFLADGTFGEGGNSNEFKWQMKDGLLEVHRKSKLLQNRFRYDPRSEKFFCTNDPDAEGYKDQVIYRR
ncbi:hypothetical protein V5279_25185 [Bradyrhizobium sp. 26S5]|uniref:hypothetical protein n=1 Tax=Bradyrhizobium sp. 26S5 TaxID=3139729 RepID=UPI0030CF34DA